MYSLPNIQIDLKRFHLITPEAATGTLLVNREALAAVIGDAAGANSDFYPKLDLTTEQARFEKRFAKGFAGLGEDRFDLGALLASVKINPTDEPLAPLDIERVRFRAVSAALRAGRGPAVDGADRTRFRLAASKYQTLKDRMAAGHPPVDWTEFILLFHEVEKDLMGGTMGWSYDPFYDSVLQFCKAQNAPADAVATVKFMRAVSGYNWIEATAQIDALLFSLENGLKWIDQDTFRDGAVVALLKTGQNGKARQVFNRMAERTERKPHDLRVRMLGAAVAAVTVGDTVRVKKQ